MKNRKYLISTLLFLALLAGGGERYAASQQEETLLEFGMFTGSNWNVENPNSYIIIDQAIKEFEEEHEGVKIHYYSGVLKDDYSEWLSRKLMRDEMPDVFMVLNDDFNLFSSLGVMKKLDNLMEKDKAFDEAAYYKSALETGVYGECQYAIPYEIVPMLMFVNKTLLEQEGIDGPPVDWNWEDLYDICSQVTRDTDGDGSIDQFGTYNYSWQEAVYSNGDALFDMDGKTSFFASESVMEAIKFARRISDLTDGKKVTQEDFDSGNVAFMPMSFAQYRTYRTYPYKIKKHKDFQWDCTTFPSFQSGKNISVVDSLLMGISARTKHEKLAWEFLKKLTYDETVQRNLLKYSQGVSALKAVTSSQEAETVALPDKENGGQMINARFLNDVIENGIIMPKFAKYKQALSLADNEISKMFDENRNIESSLKKMQRTINSYLKE